MAVVRLVLPAYTGSHPVVSGPCHSPEEWYLLRLPSFPAEDHRDQSTWIKQGD